MTDSEHHGLYCAEYSAQAQEQLFGTAPRARVWLLLEYASQWAPQAFEDSTLPPPVKNVLAAATRSIPRSRVQMIRHHVRPGTDFAFYMAISQPSNPCLFAFRLKAYADLLRLDLPAMAACDARYDRHRTGQPLFLVCTHGARDQCCARLGIPVYNALARQPELDVWQTSHVGGHRFGANVVCLPVGLYYGRVAPGDVEELVADYFGRRITLDKYRGRSIHEAPAQAGEHFVRAQTGIADIDGLTVSEVQDQGGDRWRVACRTSDGMAHVVEFVREAGAVQTYTNCKDAQPSAQGQYRLISYSGAR